MLQAGKLYKKIKERFIKWLLTDIHVEPLDESMDTARRFPTNEATPKTIFKIKF